MSMMNWHIVSTKAEFNAGSPIDTSLYFIADTHEIYRGSESYTESIITYTDTLPENPAKGKLYINTTNLGGKMYNGSSWEDVVKPLVDTIEPDGSNPVTGKAVADYVAAEIAKITGGEGASVITNITWDEINQILDIYKGSAKESITFDGLGVSLEYTKSTGSLQLKDTSGNLIGDPVNLDLEKFVTGGEYDPNTKMIILYFDNKTGEESEDKIEIPVGDLVDTYTAGETNSVTMNVSGNQFTANVRISVEGGNSLEIKNDGLYVSIPDLSGKMNKMSGDTAGHILVSDGSGQAKDSGVSVDEVGRPQIFTGTTTPEEASASGTPKKGDFCIITKPIGEGTDKSEITGYVHNGSGWAAMDGNYSAENVYFPEDLMTTVAVGNITLENGQAAVGVKGKNIIGWWNAIFVKEKNPTITQPSVSVSCPQAKAYEVGTSVTPTYTATLNAGKYEFGPATGITATAWDVKDTASHALTSNSGQFDAFIVEDGTNYKITATASYNNGAIPLTNTKNEYPNGQIKAGSKSGTSGAITGFRAGFYGTLESKDGEINSALVRSLANKTNNAVSQGTVWNLTIPVGAMRIVFAYDATIRDVSSVLDINGMSAEIKTAFTKYTVDVEGANAYTTKSYKVYVMDLASANDTQNTFKITL